MVSEQFEQFKDVFENNISLDMGKLRTPGTSILLFVKDKIIYEGYYGTKDRSTNEPIDQHSIFGIGSASKSFTCLAIMQLAEKNLLSINDPVAKYIPLKLGSKEKPITIRHLMSHASGIPALDTSLTINYATGMDKDMPLIPMSTKEDVLRFINNAQSEVIFEPQERFFYFNGGFTLLGYIIETVSGVSYKEYLQKNIFEPIGMNNTAFLNDKQLQSNPNVAKGYLPRGTELQQVQVTVDHINNAAGGIASTIGDLQKYLTAMITKDTKLLSNKAKYDEMFTHQNKSDMFENFIPDAEQDGYGFGWALYTNFHGRKVLEHGGHTSNYSTVLLFIPEEELGLIILANGSREPSLNHAIALIQAFLGFDPKKENLIYKQQEKIRIRRF